MSTKNAKQITRYDLQLNHIFVQRNLNLWEIVDTIDPYGCRDNSEALFDNDESDVLCLQLFK